MVKRAQRARDDEKNPVDAPASPRNEADDANDPAIPSKAPRTRDDAATVRSRLSLMPQ